MVRCHVGRRGRIGAEAIAGITAGLSFARPSGRAFFGGSAGGQGGLAMGRPAFGLAPAGAARVERAVERLRCFGGQLWVASDYQLRVRIGHELVAPEHKGRPVLASGYMDAHDGLLVVADLWSASTFDGAVWRQKVDTCWLLRTGSARKPVRALASDPQALRMVTAVLA